MKNLDPLEVQAGYLNPSCSSPDRNELIAYLNRTLVFKLNSLEESRKLHTDILSSSTNSLRMLTDRVVALEEKIAKMEKAVYPVQTSGHSFEDIYTLKDGEPISRTPVDSVKDYIYKNGSDLEIKAFELGRQDGMKSPAENSLSDKFNKYFNKNRDCNNGEECAEIAEAYYREKFDKAANKMDHPFYGKVLISIIKDDIFGKKET